MKRKMMYFATVGTIAISPLSVMASESGSANSAVVTAMQSTANDMIATGNSIIPIALTVVGLALVVVFGIRMFKKVAK